MEELGDKIIGGLSETEKKKVYGNMIQHMTNDYVRALLYTFSRFDLHSDVRFGAVQGNFTFDVIVKVKEHETEAAANDFMQQMSEQVEKDHKPGDAGGFKRLWGDKEGKVV